MQSAVSISPQPFTCYHSTTPTVPVLLSVPHAGRDYPPELLANLRVAVTEIVRLEDRYADRLVQPAIAQGFPAIVAHRARAWIDLNRAETDIDIGMFSGSGPDLFPAPGIKSRGGLGLFPRRLQSCGELWRAPMQPSDAIRRLQQLHRPYHQAVGDILGAMRDRFGYAVLIDVHSMPPIVGQVPRGGDAATQPKIVIGDRFGRSAASLYAELVTEHCAANGWHSGLNSPYSGDYILQTHGKPEHNIHAVQLEIDRSLYLDDALREPSGGLSSVAAMIAAIARDIVGHRSSGAFAEAAE